MGKSLQTNAWKLRLTSLHLMSPLLCLYYIGIKDSICSLAKRTSHTTDSLRDIACFGSIGLGPVRTRHLRLIFSISPERLDRAVSPEGYYTRNLNRKEVNSMADTGYCVKCKTKREMKDAERVTMKNGKPALKGKCATCGTSMNVLLSAKE